MKVYAMPILTLSRKERRCLIILSYGTSTSTGNIIVSSLDLEASNSRRGDLSFC